MDADQVTGLSYVVAFGAGLISFLSPCVLPIVPGYLAVITGLDVAEDRTRAQTWGILRDTGLFVAGFSAVFIALGLSATTVGRTLFDNQLLLTRLSGALVLAMALFLLGSLFVRAPWLYVEQRFHPDLGRFGRAAPPVAGAAFGFGWTPCIGPVLGSILALAASSGRTTAAAGLLATYSAGLGIPFMVTGLAFGRVAGALEWVRRRLPAITVAASVTLASFGLLLITNRLIWVTSRLQDGLRAVGLEWLVNLG